jgi:Ca2+-binding RTX toxin-like protein
MGTINFNQSVNMLTPSIWYGTVYSASSNTIILYNDIYVAGYYGSGFTFSVNGDVIGGVLTNYEQYAYGILDYSASGFNLNAATAYNFIESANPSGFQEWVLSGNDTLNGSGYSDLLMGYEGSDVLSGNNGDDILFGGAGDDVLFGGVGDDVIYGSLGNDVISGDLGIDYAIYNYSYTPSNYSIVYSGGTYTISGLEGTDTITGVEYFTFNGIAYEATTFVDTTAPTVSTFSPTDGLTGVAIGSNIVVTFSEAIKFGTGNIEIRDGSAAGTIIATYNVASPGSNLSISGSTLTINPTSDLAYSKNYYVTFANGAIKDIAGNNYAGTSTYDFTTGAAPSSAINGTSGNDTLTGTSNADVINGLAGNDTLNGGAGVDTLVGGLGNDTYLVDSTTDTITENASEGTDLVQSSVTFSLASILNVENLTLTGTIAINGTGNSLDNTLTGNTGVNILNGGDGNDFLFGGLGNDTLTGGAGVDHFVFNTTLNATSNKDTITDFVSGTDKIDLENSVMTALGLTTGTLASGQFWAGAGVVKGHDADDRIVYNTTTGALYYDADGLGNTAAIQIAMMGLSIYPTINYQDFLIV